MWYFVPSKWEFVTLWCLEHNEPALAKEALKIEETLKKIYSNTSTKDWHKEFSRVSQHNNVTANDIIKYISLKKYEVPCIVHDELCQICHFAEIAGKCYEPCSVFDCFYRKFTYTFNPSFENEE